MEPSWLFLEVLLLAVGESVVSSVFHFAGGFSEPVVQIINRFVEERVVQGILGIPCCRLSCPQVLLVYCAQQQIGCHCAN